MGREGKATNRSYRLTDLKKLFLLSYNNCALPGCDEHFAQRDWDFVLAEICHIHGLNAGSARHDTTFPAERLNDYENLLLLCRNCHYRVDTLEVQRYPAEILLEIKAAHESRRPGLEYWKEELQAHDYLEKLVKSLGVQIQPPEPDPSSVVRGRVKWWNAEKGFGFLTQPDGADVFVHHTAIDGDGYRTLEDGQAVEFLVQEGQKGLQAARVRPVAPS